MCVNLVRIVKENLTRHLKGHNNVITNLYDF